MSVSSRRAEFSGHCGMKQIRVRERASGQVATHARRVTHPGGGGLGVDPR